MIQQEKMCIKIIDKMEAPEEEKAQLDNIRELCTSIFPLSYPSAFYEKLLKSDAKAYLVIEDEAPVGIVSFKMVTPSYSWRPTAKDGACREPCPSCVKRTDVTPDNVRENFIYVSMFGLIEGKRGKGYGYNMLKVIEETALQKKLEHIILHVQVSNLKAIEFYYKQGFKLVKIVKEYYYNIFPRDAFLLRKCLYIQRE
ncbi:N-alpha-acetyltransferase 50 [Nematocida sp. LUAm3]|nr:N-alpha-acetyltransferase 50 [Nematocida sp. LUAm3]KAI5174941.1 N-alpha-acetyltransferase 50 [Nematocida sp. LUAm2]KAI5177460.1 N-alpha-acetyltransferase 50 [Nematocida sp. LUAm1]